MGWRSIVLPPQLEFSQRQRVLRNEKPDLLLLQKARHPLNDTELYPHQPVVFDLDDADFLDCSLKPRIDRCIRHANLVIAGSRYIADYARKLNSQVEIIWTGAAEPQEAPALDQLLNRGPSIAWAVSGASGYPLEQQFVVSVLTELLRIRGRADYSFLCYGVQKPDDVRELIDFAEGVSLELRTFPFMQYGKFLKTLRGVSIGLTPSVADNEYSKGKSFGKNLAYLSQGVVCVVSNSVDHTLFFRHGVNGFLADDPKGFASIIDRLLNDRELTAKTSLTAFNDFQRRLTSKAAARLLHRHLSGLLNANRSA